MVALLLRSDAAVVACSGSGKRNLIGDRLGWTPFHRAAEYGSTGVMEIFLGIGIPVNFKTSSGWSALYIAARGGFSPAVSFLIQQGGKYDFEDIDLEGMSELDLVLHKSACATVIKCLEHTGEE